MIIDLTMELSYQTPVFPGSQPIKIQPVAVIKQDGWNETRMSLNSHVGTHIDAPYHMIDSGKTITEYPIEYFCLPFNISFAHLSVHNTIVTLLSLYSFVSPI